MNFSNIGDIARNLVTQNQAKNFRSMQPNLMQELTTGKSSDPVKLLKGDTAPLASLKRLQELYSGYIQNNSETAQWAQTMQLGLNRVYDSAQSLVAGLTVGPEVSQDQVLIIAKERAATTLETAYSGLQVSVAGRYLFSGTAVNIAPMQNPQMLIAGIEAAVSGLTDLDDVRDAINNFFLSGGGFETSIYEGATSDVASVPVTEGETVDLAIRADDPSFRDVLRSAAYAHVASSGVIPLSRVQQTVLINESRDIALQAKDGVIGIQAKIGFAESRIESSNAKLASARSAAEISQNNLIGVDSFKAATRLEDVNTSLEMLYAATARVSRLSFLEFMR